MTGSQGSSKTQSQDSSAADSSEPEHSPAAVEWAHRRLQKKRRFRSNLVTGVVINCFFVAAWPFSGTQYFWPGWSLGVCCVLLLLDAWQTFTYGPITDKEISNECSDMETGSHINIKP
ncbi:2TM domain-containing protein [Streptomyces sp. yara]|uniref:2TM domain-containing protein n=1 Tax=Streptomyces sp. yara TaxID=3458421 RepID=UPI00403FD825